MFTRVLAIWNAESKFKVKTLEQLVPEEMAFDHAEFTHGFASYRKLHPARKSRQNIRKKGECDTSVDISVA